MNVAEQVVPADAGRRPQSFSIVFGPARLHSAFVHFARLTMSRPSQTTVETVLSQLDAIPTADCQSFELWIPQHLTLRGQTVPAEVGMALILDKILGMGYEPDGFAEAEGGRVYRYKVIT